MAASGEASLFKPKDDQPQGSGAASLLAPANKAALFTPDGEGKPAQESVPTATANLHPASALQGAWDRVKQSLDFSFKETSESIFGPIVGSFMSDVEQSPTKSAESFVQGATGMPGEIKSQYQSAKEQVGRGEAQISHPSEMALQEYFENKTSPGYTPGLGRKVWTTIKGGGNVMFGELGMLWSPVSGAITSADSRPISSISGLPEPAVDLVAQVAAPLGWSRSINAIRQAGKLAQVDNAVVSFTQGWHSIFRPESVSKESEKASSIIRAEHARASRYTSIVQDRISAALKEAENTVHHKVIGAFADAFERMPELQRVAFLDAMERGDMEAIPKELHPVAEVMRETFDMNKSLMESLHPSEIVNWVENYLPHIFKDPEKARQQIVGMIARGQMTFEGAKSFLRDRVFKDYASARAMGFEPITTNPVVLTLIRNRDVMRYVQANRIMRAFADEGLARWLPEGEMVPNGFKEIKDKIANTRYTDMEAQKPPEPEEPSAASPTRGRSRAMKAILRQMEGKKPLRRNQMAEKAPSVTSTVRTKLPKKGRWVAQEDAAKLLERYYSPGLFENQGKLGAGSRAWRAVNNFYSQIQLGLSAFHVGFVTLDSMTSSVALGIKDLAEGATSLDPSLAGKGMKHLVMAPISPVSLLIKGDKLYRNYMGNSRELADTLAGVYDEKNAFSDHVGADSEIDRITESLIRAGGIARRPEVYSPRMSTPWQEEFRNMSEASGLQKGKKILKGSLGALAAVEDKLMSPIFQYLVPRMKLGVFYQHADDFLKRNPYASYEEVSHEMGRIWDSVENRLGEMDLDRRYWNNSVKDASILGLRAVGWNYGTVSEIGGGVTDAARDFRSFVKTGKMSYRSAYVYGLAFQTAVLGGLITYINTGRGPKDMKDYFFPPDGTGHRISMPTYAKEVYEAGVNLPSTVGFKASPTISDAFQVITNHDYFGATVTNPLFPWYDYRRAEEFAQFQAQQLEPFSFSSYRRTHHEKGVTRNLLGYITSPAMYGFVRAPSYVERSASSQRAMEAKHERESIKKMHEEGRR